MFSYFRSNETLSLMEKIRYKILIVDDNPSNAQLLANLLSEHSYEVDYALNGPDALKMVSSENFDIILLDIMMPEMDGFEVCKKIKQEEKNKDLPIIFITAKTDTESIKRAFKEGGFDYVNKPFNSGELLARVKTHIDLKISKEKIRQANTWLEEKVKQRTNEITKKNTELKEAYEEIEKSEVKFKNLSNLTFEGILIHNKGNAINCNLSFEKLFGYTREEIIDKNIIKLIIPNEHQELFERSIIKDYNLPFELEARKKDGSIIPIEIEARNILYQNFRNAKVVAIRDITDRKYESRIKEIIYNITKKANETIDLKELFLFIKTQLGNLINTNNFFIALYDEKTDKLHAPYMIDELDVLEYFPKGETLTGHVIDSKKALLTKEKYISPSSKLSDSLKHGEESKCWLGVPMLLDDKAIGAIVVQSYTDENAFSQDDVALLELISSNISHVINKIEDLAQINLLNQALIQTPAIVMISNTKGELEYVNPSFTTITGYKPEEVLGKNTKFLNPKNTKDHVYRDFLKRVIKDGHSSQEFDNLKKDGTPFKVSATLSTVKNYDGKITHIVAVEEDITEKRKLERDFVNAFIEAQEIEKQTFGEELHDGISQILSAEGMYIDLLIEKNKDRIHDKAKFLTKIKELNKDAASEARNISHGLMSYQLKRNGFMEAIKNICSDFSKANNISFKFLKKDLIDEDLSEPIRTNLFRVIQELTTNIVRHSSANKASIELSKSSNNFMKLIVRDNGIGMDLIKMKKFNKGTGQKNIERRIKHLKGTMDIDSTPKKGVCYTIKVPLID